jgi:drug/metabolite transporter (DMT)-like permease
MSVDLRGRLQLARGYSTALISAVILSMTGVLIRHLTQTYQIPALVLAFWRDGFVSLTMLALLGMFRRSLLCIDRQHLFYLVAYGFLLAIFNGLWTLSVALNGAAVSTVLVYSSAGFTVILGWWLLGERQNWARFLTVVCCLGGCMLVSGADDPQSWNSNLLGIFTGILSGLMYAVYSLMGRSASQRGLNPWSTLLYTFGFAAIFLLFFNLLPGPFLPGSASQLADFFWLRDAVTGWLVLFVLAAGPTLAGFGLYNVSLSYLPSSLANLILTSEPVFTAIMAYIFLGELMNGKQIGGSLLILAGVVFVRLYEGKQKGDISDRRVSGDLSC